MIFAFLHKKGHRRIGLILGRTREQEEHLLVKTGIAFPEILKKSGIEEPEKLVSYLDGSSIQTRLNSLLKQEPTALVVIPGDTALEVCGELNRQGLKIPDDISILSREYDNVSEHLLPPMTTIRPGYAEMSVEALNLLEQMIAHKTPKGDIACPGYLIERESVKQLKK